MIEDRLTQHYQGLGDLQSDFRNRNLYSLVASFVKGKQVVDVGCGNGLFLSFLGGHDKRVVGIEPNNDLRALASKINSGAVIIPGKAEEMLALLPEPVDTIVMIDVLEHIKEDVEHVKKVQAILKNEGEFIFVVPAHSFLYGKRDQQVGHYRRYSRKVVKNILTSNGFRVEHLRYWNALGVLPYIIAEKVLRRPLKAELRTNGKKGTLARLIRQGLDLWFRLVENNFDFGFGLSIIGVARKI